MEQIKVGRLWYPVKTLGYGNRIGIWLQGCCRKCANCISPEFQRKDAGKEMTIEALADCFVDKKDVDGLTISGGEPFDQPKGLRSIVEWFLASYGDDILIFTGYTLQDLVKKDSEDIRFVLDHISVLVDGEYKEELNDGVGMRGSSNQIIHVFRNAHRYIDAEQKERKLQCILLPDRLWMIGIPPSGSN